MSQERSGPAGWLVFNRAALVVWSLLFLLAVGEVGLRVLGRIQGFDYRLYAAAKDGFSQIPLGLSCHWPGYAYPSLCPNFAGVVSTPDFVVAYKTNSRGLRDREYAVEKPAGKTRMLALGDSFTFGHGIAYGARFTDILESAFDGVEVITMAVPGSGHDQQLMQFAYEGVEYRPDHVFVFVTGATLHPWRYYAPLLREGSVQIPVFDRFAGRNAAPTLEQRVSKAAVKWPLWRTSHVLSYLAFRVQRFALLLEFRESKGGIWSAAIQLPAGWSASATPTSMPADQVTRAEAVFRKLVEIAAANQIEVTFVNLDPNHEQGYLGRIDSRARYLDLGPMLAEQAKRHPIGFKYDMHFNPEANASIAASLIEFVNRSLNPGAASRPPSRRGSRRVRAGAARRPRADPR
ncbi:MAG TPA: SGNH/GDSL hydrolase family protein [Myxococcota bacterium]